MLGECSCWLPPLKPYLSKELNRLGHNGNMLFKDEQAQQKSAELIIVSTSSLIKRIDLRAASQGQSVPLRFPALYLLAHPLDSKQVGRQFHAGSGFFHTNCVLQHYGYWWKLGGNIHPWGTETDG